MRTKVLLTLAVIAMLLVGTAAIASNMGFKISIPLKAYAAGVHDGNNFVSLPFYNSYIFASDLFSDIPGCNEVDVYDPATSTYRAYDGFIFVDDFQVSDGTTKQLVNAQAVVAKVGADAPWIVVGSHNPGYLVPLKAYAAGTHDGNNFVAIPYHTTRTDADGLFNEVTGCNEVDLYDPATSTFRAYDAFIFMDNFPLTAGVPVVLKVGADYNWQPVHY